LAEIIPSDQTSRYKGWRSLDGNLTRYWIIENLLNPRMRPIRQATYDYHRLGLDLMHQNVEAGKAVLLKAVEAIQVVNKAQVNSMIVTMFADAKSSEIIEIFKESTSAQKTEIKQLMSKIDPSNSNKYNTVGR
jgi:hypothetical protein